MQRGVLDTRRSVRAALDALTAAVAADERREPRVRQEPGPAPLVLVALSGGADSLALAAAAGYEAGCAGIRAGAVVVDHGLQQGSAEVAARAGEQARALGLDPVLVRRVDVRQASAGRASRRSADGGDPDPLVAPRRPAGGPEAEAREARYAAFAEVAAETGAVAILTAHTRDDQAEQVLLALARGSGTRSLAGIPLQRPLADGTLILRPFLASGSGAPEVTRETTETACGEQGLEPWRDPHNSDPAYTRVRVRERVLPLLERELASGIAGALARTADLAREDADALDALAAALAERCVSRAGRSTDGTSEVEIAVAALVDQPAALRNRVIRRVADREFGAHLGRDHTLAIAALITDWRGQGPLHVPGLRVSRAGGSLVLARQLGSPRTRS